MTVANRSAADRLLGNKGQVLTLTWPGTSTYDPSTGQTTTTPDTTASVNGALLPLSAFRKTQDSMIVEGDQQLLLAAVDTGGTAIAKPKVNMTVTDANGVDWTLIAFDPLSPDGTDALYDCIVRRAA